MEGHSHFTIEEATIKDIQQAFAQGKLTARQLVDFYLHQIEILNPVLRGVIEVNPDAQQLADESDREKEKSRNGGGGLVELGELHGIPVLLKDTIGTKDKMNTTAGSYALVGSKVRREGAVVERLRKSGAIILGKSSMSEWYKFRSLSGVPHGCGSAISVAANMVSVALGTETHSSIICPSDHNSVVGLKPTVGLTSRAGVIPMAPSWDTVGPICRTVSDAVYVLDVIAGFDLRDEATTEGSKFIPEGGYKQFLNENGLKGKRLGIVRHPFVEKIHDSAELAAFELHIGTFRQKGAQVVDNLKIEHVDKIMDPHLSGELSVMMAEFKTSINNYLKELDDSPVRSLADIITFNERNPELEKLTDYDQQTFIAADRIDGLGEHEKDILKKLEDFSHNGFEKLMKEHELDAIITPGSRFCPILAIGGYPGITVPAGYGSIGMPFGICFGGLKGTEPKLIEIACAFEKATKARRPPSMGDKPIQTSSTTYKYLVCFLSFTLFLWPHSNIIICKALSIKEATIQDLQTAFHENQLTSAQLVKFYLKEIQKFNPLLKGVIEVNPDALYLARKADRERKIKLPGSLSRLHGIPVLLKDNIATKDKLNTTAGSFALVGSVVPRDAGVVMKLRRAGAIVLGKASLSEWASFRSYHAPSGWCARSGQGKNPYVLSADPCGSSSGSAISVASNMVAVSLGTETDGSILCPSGANAVVGIKPTVGLTSRAGVIPISPRQDTVGTVSDAVHVLDAIVGYDYNDPQATKSASKYIPHGGYSQFLKPNGLKGKRLGIVRNPFFVFSDRHVKQTFERHLLTLRQSGATLVDNLEIANINTIFVSTLSGEETALLAEFKISLNDYLKELVTSPVRSLAEVIAFNEKFSDVEKIKEFGQDTFLASEATNGIGDLEKKALRNLTTLTRNGFEKLMKQNKLDAIVTAGADVAPVLAIGGFPGITVPAAYDRKGVPIGICFGGLKGFEPRLIEIAYAFEQATKSRKPPTFLP
ncbi:Amidase [Handroanthus impetiginosus]|uniref:Amidase n=1 Tax=Handroanthus impetiginosus TaxID=429701 RepID=A0A2G9I520_9LAMI|nr:Amidase [Handroanthus impetiginosus]